MIMRRSKNKGTVLIITIWITTILAGLAITLAWRIRTESLMVENQIAAAKAEYAINGVIEYVKANASSSSTSSDDYEQVELGDCYYWVIKPDLSSEREVSYGLVEESSKINLNTATQEVMLKLPGMTNELAASIIDWRDENSEVTVGGAENEYYLLQPEKYECKNSDLETVEEVLLIKGGDRDVLFGTDRNVNGMLDDQYSENGIGSQENVFDAGFVNYVTVYSNENNVDANGGQREFARRGGNRDNIKQIFIDAGATESDADDAATTITNMNMNVNSVIDLYYGVKDTLKYDVFLKAADKLTTSRDNSTAGLVNVNKAPEEVLKCLPGLESSDVDDLIRQRERLNDSEKVSIVWVTKALNENQSREIGPMITTRSSQYSADIVALSKDGKAFRRYKVVIDTVDDTTVVHKRSLSHLGWPLDKDILERLRNNNL